MKPRSPVHLYAPGATVTRCGLPITPLMRRTAGPTLSIVDCPECARGLQMTLADRLEEQRLREVGAR
ncbi:MAG TPA: hypothetical protein VD948_06255 [Rhodothermales bacterium]|nr:hypothetical protein [Rhodothermales bacterium]